MYKIGDLFPIFISGTVGILSISGTYYAAIIGIDHNSSLEGSKRIHFQLPYDNASKGLCFTDSSCDSMVPVGSVGFYINNKTTSDAWGHNRGGWEGSYARNTICVQFLSLFPSIWKNAIKFCKKYRDNTGGGSSVASYVTAITDSIFYLAEYEVLGATRNSNPNERNYQNHYTYYMNGGSKVKYRHGNTIISQYWWLSSPCASTLDVCSVTSSGNVQYNAAGMSYGITPCFTVA